MKKKLLITGATGMLGRELYSALSANEDYEIYTVSRSPSSHLNNHSIADIVDPVALEKILEKIKPDIVAHCAALVNVDGCESNRDYAYNLHVTSGKIISKYPSVGKVIYISTDSVFDGQTGNYDEADATAPLNYYAQTKKEGEDTIIEYAKEYFVLRTNILGFHVPAGNSLFEWAFSSLNNGISIKGFGNVFFNPLYCGALAKVVCNLLQSSYKSGIYHLGTIDRLSKFDFLVAVAERFDFSKDLISCVELNPADFTAKRPLHTVLNVEKFLSQGLRLPTVNENLELLFKNFKSTVYDK